jgi:muramidase (phage lysozyme)
MAHPTIEVREVSGLDEANVGDTVEYKVTRYNRAQDKVNESERQFVQWAVKVAGIYSIQEVLGGRRGETLSLEIRKEWDGKEIIVMAARGPWSFDEKISHRTRVGVVKATKGFYYASDGTLLGRIGTDADFTDVFLVNNSISQEDIKNLIEAINRGENRDRELIDISVEVGMKNEELNLRAFMTTLKQTENHCNDPLPYNAKNGFTNGRLNTFTDKSYEVAPEDYKNHPFENVARGGTAAGAYQILRSTFRQQLRDNPRVIDFGPNSQDYAVVGIFSTNGIDALEYIIIADLDMAVQKLIKDRWGNTQFASLPGGGQEKRGFTMNDLRQMFKENVIRVLGGRSSVSAPIGKLLDK